RGGGGLAQLGEEGGERPEGAGARATRATTGREDVRREPAGGGRWRRRRRGGRRPRWRGGRGEEGRERRRRRVHRGEGQEGGLRGPTGLWSDARAPRGARSFVWDG